MNGTLDLSNYPFSRNKELRQRTEVAIDFIDWY
jgi:hypothetical protein